MFRNDVDDWLIVAGYERQLVPLRDQNPAFSLSFDTSN